MPPDADLADKVETDRAGEENLPFILSSPEESDTDELSALLPDKEKTKDKKEKLDSLKYKTISKTLEKAPIKKTDDENLSEIKRNHWRTVVINVGGVKYRSKISNFSKYPASRLGKIFRARTTNEILEYCDGYKPGNPPMIFFDRNDQNFNSIIDCYRMGELHVCSQNCSLVTQAGLN